MLPTIIISVILAGLVFLAVRRLFKKGACDCSSCESAGCCPGHAAKSNKH